MTPENEINTFVKQSIDNSVEIQALLPRGYVTAYMQAPDNTRPPYFVYYLNKTEKAEVFTSAQLDIRGIFYRADATTPQTVMQEVVKLFNNKLFRGTYATAARFWVETDVREEIIEKDGSKLHDSIHLYVTFYCRWVNVPVTTEEIYP